MSDDFIPLNQSTPVQQKWQPARNHHQRFNNQNQNSSGQWGPKRHNNKWGKNNSRSSFEGNTSNSINIDDYLNPSMLEDPWARLRQQNQANTSK
ncbi:uncharacterized protein LOC142973387 [Anticarsia gemmatalis]|uniref:uncharacterized protein LOC142973387 n=1 Tax=Anticarsia gemmatalis TaxID=129554 RepID=UPI003F7742A4